MSTATYIAAGVILYGGFVLCVARVLRAAASSGRREARADVERRAAQLVDLEARRRARRVAPRPAA